MHDKVNEFVVCFDIDGTLIDQADKPRTEVIAVLESFLALPNVRVVIWSGGGDGYAKTWAHRLGLNVMTAGKPTVRTSQWADLVFDDQPGCKLGKQQVIV